MTKTQLVLRRYARKENVNLEEWDKRLPHFGGLAPHRFQGFVKDYIGGKSMLKVCVYCLKPEDWDNRAK